MSERLAKSASSQTLGRTASKESVGAAPAARAPAAKAVAVMKVMKVKAITGPARGGVPAAKKAAPMPARGGVIKAAAKGKAKAIAAKTFKTMASSLKKSASTEAIAGEGTWYFMSDLRKMKEGKDDPKAWTKYDAKMQKALETAYTKKFKQYTMERPDGTKYIVRFKDMMQFRADDKYLQRPVKRV